MDLLNGQRGSVMKIMKKIVALLRRVRAVLVKAVEPLRSARTVSGKVGTDKWDRLMVALDYLYCCVRFRVTEGEYLNFQFYNFKDCYRKNFLLRYHQKRKFNRLYAQQRFKWSKYLLYQKLGDCFSREMIQAPACGADAFVEFAKKHGKIIIKPDAGSLGRDVRVFTYQNDAHARILFEKLPEICVCEEFSCQHEKMSALSPGSVNTIRILSLWEEDGATIISATLRTGGQTDSLVDNLKKGGVGAQVDKETGIVYTNGFDYNEHQYVKHPLTGVQFLGFQIPYWEEAVALVKKAHAKMPEIRLIGWDIAITQTGVELVEANNRPGTPITQMLDLIPKGEKILRVIRATKKEKR